MPGIDAQLLFSDAQAISGTTGVASTNSYDCSSDRNIGLGSPLIVSAIFDVSLAGAATETITIAVQTDDNSGFSSPTTLATSATLSEAQAAAGQIATIVIPPDLVAERWVRLLYTMAGTTPTATVTAWAGPANMAPTPIAHYPRGFSIT